MKTYLEKVFEDSYYQHTYKYLGRNSLAPAGFLYNKNSAQISSLNINDDTIIVDKLINNLEHLSKREKNIIKQDNKAYVLLSTGSFNPVHLGHVKMMELAKIEIEKIGHVVIGGFLSPSHDNYVFTKDERLKCCASQRLLMCNQLLINNNWLCADGWESLDNKDCINFTDVICRTQLQLNKKLKKQLGLSSIEVVYVFGSDNHTFLDAFIAKGMCICVPRKQQDILKCLNKQKEIFDFNLNEPEKRIFISNVGENISSTQIRNAMLANNKM